ncbi:PDZ domain-containing protein [Ferrimonas pelagia]|uniref:PDZ domain-containing protein n=2 Tax=Ferrimonas pelagia TaxID=1177826 RepID=A0ABP9FLZ8_9GAMM
MAIVLTPVQAGVRYDIVLEHPQRQWLEVSMHLPTSESSELILQLPNWRTGRYQLLPMADGIRQFEAVDGQGQQLNWGKVDRARWRITLDSPGPVTVRYRVHANELADRSRHVDDSHAYLDASGLLMYTDAWRDQAVTVSLQVPQGWRSVSGMERIGPHAFRAANYDILVDSPIETGLHQSWQFQVDQRDYELVIWGEGNYDAAQILEDLKALVAVGGRYYRGQYPYQYYLFIVHATDGARGATEHRNSTVIQRPRWRFGERKDYLSFLSTASHELVHTWHVKRYRPKGLVPYDYQNDNYSELLWFAEGGTSYLQDRWLLEAGIMTPKEFLNGLAKRIHQHQRRPGVAIQSVSEASFDNWIARHGDYGHNNSVSIYSQGYMASWALESWLLNRGSSMQALHQALLRRFSLPASYDPEQFRGLLSELGQASIEPWWQQHVMQPLSLNFDALLAEVGLEWVDATEREWDLGLATEQGEITRLDRHGAAWTAGLALQDRIVALNGLRWQASHWRSLLAGHEEGDIIEVSVFRRDRLIQRPLRLLRTPKVEGTIQPMASTSPEQRHRFLQWSGIEWPFSAEE